MGTKVSGGEGWAGMTTQGRTEVVRVARGSNVTVLPCGSKESKQREEDRDVQCVDSLGCPVHPGGTPLGTPLRGGPTTSHRESDSQSLTHRRTVTSQHLTSVDKQCTRNGAEGRRTCSIECVTLTRSDGPPTHRGECRERQGGVGEGLQGASQLLSMGKTDGMGARLTHHK